MTKRERVLSAARRGPVDRPPVSFWRHVPDVDHTAAGLADAMLAFHRKWDLDFVKVMSSGVYCVEDWGCRVAYQGSPNGAKQCTEHAVRSRADWARISPLDEGAGALGRELEAVRLNSRGGARRRRADPAHALLPLPPAHVGPQARGGPAGRRPSAPSRPRSSQALDAINRHDGPPRARRPRSGRRRLLLRHPDRRARRRHRRGGPRGSSCRACDASWTRSPDAPP